MGDNKIINFKELCNIIDNKNVNESLIGTLVSGIINVWYGGMYRIIGVNHDGTDNTVDLLTEDCVRRISSGFGAINRDYNAICCDARIFVENTFYNAFDSSVKEYIKPMEVKYYYSANKGVTGGSLETNIAYGKLLSFNEVGTTYASSTSRGDKYVYCPNDGGEGNIYPYFNATGSTLNNLRIKKYNGEEVDWWLRSRITVTTIDVGIICKDGTASGCYYTYNDCYLAPVIRLGSKNEDLHNKKDTEMETQDNRVIGFKELCDIIDNKNVDDSLVGTLVSGINNSLYDGMYRIIGVNHDGTDNTVDLLTEDCVKQANSGFGYNNRDYNDVNCYARIFVEDTFCNAFSADVKKYIAPMDIKYYYYNSNTSLTSILQTTTRYAKLLSYNEVGYGISGPSKYNHAPNDIEGNVYPYFNNTTTSLRMKKYNGETVIWWLRSRTTIHMNCAGGISIYGNANYYDHSNPDLYLAPIIRLGSKTEILNNTEDTEMGTQDDKVINFKELCNIIDNKNVNESLVGTLVSGINNSLYDGMYRIIGVNHDGTDNTVDLLTEDCVQEASSGFGGTNRHYNSPDCYARIFAEETFYNAFDSSIKEYIRPMKVEYRYSAYSTLTSQGYAGILQTTTTYGKLLSFNEVGTTYSSAPNYYETYDYCQDDGAEGNKYPYFNATGETLGNLRIKKYNGTAVSWWLRSRDANGSKRVGGIDTNGSAGDGGYSVADGYLAPVIRIGSKNEDLNDTEDKDIKTEDDKVISFKELCDIVDNKNVDDSLVGTLVSGINNSLYDGMYRIIGVNHDGTDNTVDLLTEDCVQEAIGGFGEHNRDYNDVNCYARIFVEDTFYNAFSDDVKKYIAPMDVKYYYDPAVSLFGILQTNTRYGKLLSYNEIGYGISGPSNYSYAPDDHEGDLYPYFNNTTASLRVKKYNGKEVCWWLRSRTTPNTNLLGLIGADGGAGINYYSTTRRYLAPVIRIGSKKENTYKKVDDTKMKDNVNHPNHYTDTSLECIEAMEIVFGKEAVMDFCACNAWKYIWRWKTKNGNEDLAKANWYLARASKISDEIGSNKYAQILDGIGRYIANEIPNTVTIKLPDNQ